MCGGRFRSESTSFTDQEQASDEFEQLVTNATFKLTLQIPTATLNRVGEAWLAERGDISQHPITFEEFWEWFGANFGDAGACVSGTQ